MNPQGVFGELDRLISESRPEDRPGLALALSARIGMLAATMATGQAPTNENRQHRAEAERETWITPQDAALIAGVSVERIYSWAKGERWASRPSRRCLRISESGFRRWLQTRG